MPYTTTQLVRAAKAAARVSGRSWNELPSSVRDEYVELAFVVARELEKGDDEGYEVREVGD